MKAKSAQKFQSLDFPSIAVVGFSMLALFSSDDFSTFLILIVAALIVPGFIISRRPQTSIYHTAWNIGTCVFVLVVLGAAMLIGIPALDSLTAICLYMLVHKWFVARYPGDHLQIWVFTILLILVSIMRGTGHFQSFWILGWGISSGFLFSQMGTLRLLESIKQEKSANPSFHLSTVAGMLVLSTILATPLFLFTPRPDTESAIYQRQEALMNQAGILRAGFTSKVSLNDLSNIRQSNTPVLKVIDPEPHFSTQVKFRVNTLEIFNGTEWDSIWRLNHELLDTGTNVISPPTIDFLSQDAIRAKVAERGWHRLYRVQLLNQPGTRLPVPEGTARLTELPLNSRLYLHSNGEIIVGGASNPREFIAWQLDPSRSESATKPLLRGSVLPFHLEVPQILKASLEELVNRAVPKGDNQLIDQRELARQFERFLIRNGTYSLELEELGKSDYALLTFMEELNGHCELYATTMAMMLRFEGIPSRLVTGFSGGEIIPTDDPASPTVLLVTSGNAHAWVEAWFPGAGWVSFDPTPSAPEVSTSSQRPFFSIIANSLTLNDTDFLTGWLQSFDANRQQTMMRSLSRNSLKPLESWESGLLLRTYKRVSSNLREPELMLLASFLVLINGIAWWVRLYGGRMAWFRRFSAGNQKPENASPLYLTILKELHVSPQEVIQPGKTPGEILREAFESARLEAKISEEILEKYQLWRFGGAKSKELAKEILHQVREGSTNAKS